ncbi:hypothetical protein C8A03DRAFT_37722 [Achaetomium macrosporum]|uniref:Uncharacterized protein n=1 Tax=Achaetomium macrosporum TaxID=79813 RepID=A0AAN7C3D7_9PEZI|nr:hypothetical protein C8A03DRAFT_37722 [Achaetomium macrosporum]
MAPGPHRSVSREHGRPLRRQPASPLGAACILFSLLLSVLGLLLKTAPAAAAAAVAATTTTPAPTTTIITVTIAVTTTTCCPSSSATKPALDRQIPIFDYGPSAMATNLLLQADAHTTISTSSSSGHNNNKNNNKGGGTSTRSSTSTRHHPKTTNHFPGSMYDTPGHAIASGLIVGVVGTGVFWAIIGVVVFIVKVYFVWIWRALFGIWRGWHAETVEVGVDTRR